MFITAYVLLFILKIRFPTSSPISHSIRRRYGPRALEAFRKYEQAIKRHEKANLDKNFLHSCKAYNISPKFLCFKLYKQSLINSSKYKEFQATLLDQEIESKNKHIKLLSETLTSCKITLKNEVSFIDFAALQLFVRRNIDKYKLTITETHSKKLHKLGARLQLSSCPPNEVIFNYSSYSLSVRERFLLSFGLDFGLPVYKPSFYRYFLQFELLLQNIKSFSTNAGRNFSTLANQIKGIACSTYYGFKPHKVFSPIFKRSDIQVLKTLGNNNSLIICPPDKGRGVVLLNKCDYIAKVTELLSDKSKFKQLPYNDPFRETIKQEDSINRFLSKLKDTNIITAQQYDSLFATGSSPGILYGLPKVHKPGIPIRPILAAYNTATYKLAKYLLPLLEPITRNQYTLKNSYAFYHDITSRNIGGNSFMVSYDITSLYTNIPVIETIEIICNKFFQNSTLYHGYNRAQFKQLLLLTVNNTQFIFNEILYKQIDGLSMGNPAAPHLANIFLCHLEEQFMQQCPSDIKPLFYRRYLDDTIAVFNNEQCADKFFNFINNFHSNIQFTIEKEQCNKLPFLDVHITRQNDGYFTTSVYRKPTFTGLTTSFFSFIPLMYKINVIRILIYRAYHLSSSYVSFSTELKNLEQILTRNGFPLHLIQKYIRKFLHSVMQPSAPNFNVPKKIVYLSLPYLGPPSHKMAKNIKNALSHYYSYIDFKFTFRNNFQIKSFFRYKDKIPTDLQSNIIYKYKCETCNSFYIGSSIKQAKVRFTQHLGTSFRTGRHLSKPMYSAPRNHSETSNHKISYNNFSVIDHAANTHSLRILESLYLLKHKPSLNIDKTAEPLFSID